MAWIIGIDEAGYGPNLGPLVMSAIILQVPQEHLHSNHWQLLSRGVRRKAIKDDPRLHIDDSKKVYSSAKGIDELERSVLAALAADRLAGGFSLHSWLVDLAPSSWEVNAGLPWYRNDRTLPLGAPDGLEEAAHNFHQVCRNQHVTLSRAHAFILEPESFNRTLDRWGSKGAALAQGLQSLVRSVLASIDPGEPMLFAIDKHGGRNTYAALLQEAFPGGMVLASSESMTLSVYQVVGHANPVTLQIQPRADSEHFCVALASMLSKYVRELLMHEFNRFWQVHHPDLKPTAGYYSDAPRFFEAIRPTVEKMGIAVDAVWRRR